MTSMNFFFFFKFKQAQHDDTKSLTTNLAEIQLTKKALRDMLILCLQISLMKNLIRTPHTNNFIYLLGQKAGEHMGRNL